MPEVLVSCWESSSSSNCSDNGDKSSSDSRKNHPRPEDQDEKPEDEHEVIFDLDGGAMSQLPVHLQHNMREIQRERLERIEHDNVHAPVRKHSDRDSRDTRAEEWFRTLIARLPPAPSLGIPSHRDNPDVMSSSSHELAQRGRRVIQEQSKPAQCAQANEIHKKTENDALEHNRYAHSHRMHATSIKERAYGNQNDIPRRSERYIPNLHNPASKYSIGQAGFYRDQQEEEAEAEDGESRSQLRKKSSFIRPGMRRRVKCSIRKMSSVFKKG